MQVNAQSSMKRCGVCHANKCLVISFASSSSSALKILCILDEVVRVLRIRRRLSITARGPRLRPG